MGGLSSWSNSYALLFDATNEAVQIDQNYSSTYDGSFSLNFWHKSDTHLSQYFWINGNFQADRFWVHSNNSRALIVRFLPDGFGSETTFTTDTGVVGNDGNWRNIGITLTRSATGSTATTLAVYINGSPVNIATTSGSTTSDEHGNYTSPGDTFIGRILYNDGSYTTSAAFSMDEIGLWNTNLTEANHAAIYNSGATINLQADSGNYNTSANLQAYYRFEEGSGTDIANSVGPVSDAGTLLNSVSFVTGVDG